MYIMYVKQIKKNEDLSTLKTSVLVIRHTPSQNLMNSSTAL